MLLSFAAEESMAIALTRVSVKLQLAGSQAELALQRLGSVPQCLRIECRLVQLLWDGRDDHPLADSVATAITSRRYGMASSSS